MAFGQEAKAARKSQASAQGFAKQQMRSAHQWEVIDLTAAGLNPILSAGGSPNMPTGGGTPFGSDQIAQSVQDALGTAKNVGRMGPEIRLLKQQEKLVRQDVQKSRNDTTLKHSEEERMRMLTPWMEAKAQSDAVAAGWNAISAKEQSGISASQNLLHQYALPGASALSAAQATQRFRDAVKFSAEAGAFADPFKGLLNLSIGGKLGGKGVTNIYRK